MIKIIDLNNLDKIREEEDKFKAGFYKGYIFDNSFVYGVDKEYGWNIYIGNPFFISNRIKRLKTLEEVKKYIDKIVGE